MGCTQSTRALVRGPQPVKEKIRIRLDRTAVNLGGLEEVFVGTFNDFVGDFDLPETAETFPREPVEQGPEGACNGLNDPEDRGDQRRTHQ